MDLRYYHGPAVRALARHDRCVLVHLVVERLPQPADLPHQPGQLHRADRAGAVRRCLGHVQLRRPLRDVAPLPAAGHRLLPRLPAPPAGRHLDDRTQVTPSAPPPPQRFSGCTVAVTGAASGIGRASAARLAAEGAHVLLLDRDRDGCEALAETVRAAGGRADVFLLDLASETSVGETAAAVAAAHPALHGLVGCAGLVHVDGSQENPFLERGLAGWDLLFAVNVRGM